MTSIELTDVSKHFGRVRAVDDVDLTFTPGITGLLGPNGAGKTTLLRMIATVLAPDTGRLRVSGHDPATADGRVEIRRRLGYLPQEPGYYRNFSAFAFVDYVAVLKEYSNRRIRHDEVRRVLGLVGLADAARTPIRTLSGGMRRRVGIAQALLGEPDLLVLDEPTAGLDPEQRLRFRELLTARSTTTTLLSTHQTDDVAALCQRVIVFDAGKVRFDGTPDGLAAVARDRVWSAASRDPNATLAYVTGDGQVRHLGDPPVGAHLVAPTVEDGYLLLARAAAPSGMH